MSPPETAAGTGATTADGADLHVVSALRAALLAADYTFEAVTAVLGPVAQAALARNETVPGLLATAGGSPVETLARLWLLQATVPINAAEAALPGLVDQLCNAGILERSMSEVAARVDVRPYGVSDGPDGPDGSDGSGSDLWIVADLTPGLDGGPQRVSADYVLGISPAATSLAELTIRRPVGRALDLGTGCGVQALHLTAHADEVVATDVNSRALWLTRVNAALNTQLPTRRISIREGSFFEPLAGERFDLIVTNPPFVISPGTGERLVYRDSGLPGDRVVEDIVRAAPDHLTPGGTCQILANWMILEGEPWQERLTGWCSGVDVWAVQREQVDLPTYVELWLKDAGLHPSTGTISVADYQRRYDTWLSWLRGQGVEAIGFGWINLRRTEAEPQLRLEEWRYDVAQPLGDEVAAHFDRVDWLRTHEDLSAAYLTRRGDVIQETSGVPGAEDPAAVILRQQIGMRRARQVTSAEAALVGACDGDLSVEQINGALTELDAGTVTPETVRELVLEGFLEA